MGLAVGAASLIAILTLRSADDGDRGIVPGGADGSSGTSTTTGPVLSATTVGPQVTDTTAPTAGTGAVGYVGCSLSRGAVGGYHDVGGTRFWPPAPDYSGGTIERWAESLANSSRYWAAFDAMNQAMPSKVIWWQLCTFSDSSDEANYTDTLAVLQEIGSRIPGVTVYVSAQNGWEAPHVCDLTGSDGLACMQALTDRLAGENRARLGPDVGDVPRSQIAPDGCHPDAEGRKLLGARLAAFGF